MPHIHSVGFTQIFLLFALCEFSENCEQPKNQNTQKDPTNPSYIERPNKARTR